MVVYIRKVKKSESKSQHLDTGIENPQGLCISVKLKNLKANHNPKEWVFYVDSVVYIRKVKKSESKSQHQGTCSTKIIFERNRGRLSTQLIRLS